MGNVNKNLGKKQSAAGPSLKRLTYKEIQHLFIDRELTHRELARRLSERGLKVSHVYVALLLHGQRLGVRPYGRRVLEAIAEELGVDVQQLIPEGGEQK